jgi:hypothetical protein
MTTCGNCVHFEKDSASTPGGFTNWKGYCHLFNQNTYRNDGNNCHGFESLHKTRCKIPIEDAIEDFEKWFRSCAWEKTDKEHFDCGIIVIEAAKLAVLNSQYARAYELELKTVTELLRQSNERFLEEQGKHVATKGDLFRNHEAHIKEVLRLRENFRGKT